MILKLSALLAFILAFVGTIFFARRDGINAAKVDAMRREIERNAKEQERANEINNRVSSMSIDDVRERLRNTKDK